MKPRRGIDVGLLVMLKDYGVIRNEEVTLKSGEKSNFYLDVKKAYGHPLLLELIAKSMVKIMERRYQHKIVSALACMGHGGIPLGTILGGMLSYECKIAYIRDRPKGHGLTGMIDGYQPTKEDRVLIVDDVFTTGGSINNMKKEIESTGAKVLGAIVVFERGSGSPEVEKFDYLYTDKDILTL